MAKLLTDDEMAVMNALTEAWNGFLKLPCLHSDDVNDFRNGVHTLQRIIMSRPALLSEIK